jgi:DUF2927 family protein
MRICASVLVLALSVAAALGASGKRPAPADASKDAPPEFTHFSADELARGFMALAFGSDLHIGAPSRGLHRFNRRIRVRILSHGRVDRTKEMRAIVEDFARNVPNLQVSIADGKAESDVELRLIDEKKFRPEMRSAFGANVTKTLIARTNPQCITSVKSNADGTIAHVLSLLIVDKDEVFRDCAYHELMHVFGLPNHDQKNSWTTLNQNREVGYLSVYDRIMLNILYDPRIPPGTTKDEARAALPRVIDDMKKLEPSD